MIPYNQKTTNTLDIEGIKIASFISDNDDNLDKKTVNSFGEEWNKFAGFDEDDLKVTGDQYFDIVDDKMLNNNTIALDAGCGSGRWSRYISDKIKHVEAIDPSNSIISAAVHNNDRNNIRWTQASIANIPFENNSFDFVFSLGVLHHIPDTEKALKDVVSKLKEGGTLLLYLYYALDNRSLVYKTIFQLSNLIRMIISKLPGAFKRLICDVIALMVYLPLVVAARFCKRVLKVNWYNKLPLSYYHDKSFHIMRNDSLDRFGTPLEQRFTKKEIEEMMQRCGLSDIRFSNNEPYWHATGQKIVNA